MILLVHTTTAQCLILMLWVFLEDVVTIYRNTFENRKNGLAFFLGEGDVLISRMDRDVSSRGVTGIFFWGGKVIFPDYFPGVKCFFPVENSHFGRPKTNLRRFQKRKAKKKKKSSPLFITFPTSISNFPPSLLQFSFFSS